MDRRQVLSLAILGFVAACGEPAPRRPGPPDGARARVVARGTLGYAVAFAGARLVTVELGERFELVVRSADGAREHARVDLGPPDRDWVALTAVGDRAWVGGEPGEVVVVDLARGAAIARWPVGAPVTALAATDDGHVAIGDAEGAVCLRRGDGALLQCAVAHAGPVTGLAVDRDAVISTGAGGARRWAIPSLAVAPAGADDDASPRWRGAPVRIDGAGVIAGGDVVVQLHARVLAVDVSDDGALAVAGWVTALDQPSVVIITPDR